MKGVRSGRAEKGSERRRTLAEVNLISESKPKTAAPDRRGCALPFIGVLVAGLGAVVAAGWHY